MWFARCRLWAGNRAVSGGHVRTGVRGCCVFWLSSSWPRTKWPVLGSGLLWEFRVVFFSEGQGGIERSWYRCHRRNSGNAGLATSFRPPSQGAPEASPSRAQQARVGGLPGAGAHAAGSGPGPGGPGVGPGGQYRRPMGVSPALPPGQPGAHAGPRSPSPGAVLGAGRAGHSQRRDSSAGRQLGVSRDADAPKSVNTQRKWT